MSFLRRNLFSFDNLVRFIVSGFIGIGVFVLDLLNVGDFSHISTYTFAFLITGFVETLLAALVWCTNEGAFDIFGFYPTRKKIGDRKENYTEFVERKTSERKQTKWHFLVYLFVAICFYFLSLIFYLITLMA